VAEPSPAGSQIPAPSPAAAARRDSELEREQVLAIARDKEENHTEIRAVVFRSRIGEAYGFGLGLTSTGVMLVTDLLLGGLADGQLQVGDRVHSINGETLGPTKSFEDLVQIANESMTCMVVCSRLRGLEHPTPLSDGTAMGGPAAWTPSAPSSPAASEQPVPSGV